MTRYFERINPKAKESYVNFTRFCIRCKKYYKTTAKRGEICPECDIGKKRHNRGIK